MADTGNGATLTLSGFTVDIVSIEIGSQTRGTGSKSLLSTTGFDEKFFHDLADAGSATITYLLDQGDALPSINAAVASATITAPLLSGSSAATYIGTAGFTEVSPPSFMNNELLIGKVVLTYDGVTGPTWTAET